MKLTGLTTTLGSAANSDYNFLLCSGRKIHRTVSTVVYQQRYTVFCKCGGSQKSQFEVLGFLEDLTAKTIEGASLAFQSVDNIHGGNRLSFGVLGVGDGVTDHVFQKHFEDTAGLLIDKAGDTLYTTTASQTTDCWLGDPLDVVTEDFPVALGTSLSETFASLSTARHDELFRCLKLTEIEPRNLKR